MKSSIIWAGALVFMGVIGARLEGAQVTGTVSERGPHHRVITTETTVINERGEPEIQHGRYVELAVGMHYAKATPEGTQWLEARPEFEVFADGLVARTTQHRIILAKDLHGQSAIEILTADNKRLPHSPRWLVYTDPKSGQSAIIAAVQSCEAQLVASNQVVYPNAFDTLKASLRYTLRLDGFEADVILHEQPPDPGVFGLGDDCYLEIWHEFYQAPMKQRINKGRPDPATGLAAVEAVDTTEVDTGVMQFGQGKAFKLESGTELPDTLPVKRQWYQEKNRQFLIERVSHTQAREYLRQLPNAKRGAQLKKVNTRELCSLSPALPPAVKPGLDAGLAMTPPKIYPLLADLILAKGFVIDYDLQGATNNFVAHSCETIFVVNTVTLAGVTCFEGGVVFKFPPQYAGKLLVTGPLHLETTPYRPIILTAKDDDKVGSIIEGSSGTPNGFYGYPYLEFPAYYSQPFKLKNLRIKHATLGVMAPYVEVELANAQFIDCNYAISAFGSTVSLRNALFNNVAYAFWGNNSVEYRCEQVTFNGITGHLNYQSPALSLTNCLLVNVAATNAYTGNQAVALASASGVFCSQGGGDHYLAANSPYRNAGSTNLNAELARDLKQLTTQAPQYMNPITVDTTLKPLSMRDTDIPDLGYHYAPVDYMSTAGTIEAGVTLTLAGGVVWGFYGTAGLNLTEGSRLVSQGTPFQPVHWCNYRSVQEKYFGENGVPRRSFVQVLSAFDNLPAVQCRFTDISWLSASAEYRKLIHLSSGICLVTNLDLRDCELWNVALPLQPLNNSAGKPMTLEVNNCLLFRNSLTLTMGTNGDTSVLNANLRNNLFYGGTAQLLASVNGNYWNVYDNLFHSNELQCGASLPNHGYNGYLGTSVPGNGSGNVILSEMVYARGPLGNYYQASTTLHQQGSRTAASAGLYHYTVKPGNQKAGNAQVSIGLHYAACPGIWASTEGFSDTQGSSQWYYHYASLGGQPTSQMPFYLYYGGTVPYWGGTSDFWAMVGREWQHTGSTLDSARTFSVPSAGEYRLYTQTRNEGYLGGDGVSQRILLGANTLRYWWAIPGSRNDLPILYQGNFAQGDQVHFQVNCLTGNTFDTTYWTQVIQAAPYDRLCDTDGDGLADKDEDLNGNGVVDAGESDWLTPDTNLKSAVAVELFNPVQK